MKNLIPGIAIFAAVLMPQFAFADKGGALDGKTYTGVVGMKGDEKGDPDDFIFANGKFDSPACHEFGFGDGPYKVSQAGAKTNFDATTTDKDGAKMLWKGVVSGDSIEGTVHQVSAKNEPLREMWFRGKKK